MQSARRLILLVGCGLAALSAVSLSGGDASGAPTAGSVRAWKIYYRAHNGARRAAWLLLPSSYSPENNPRIPLVISPHGRGLSGRRNAAIWGNLPGVGGFAVVSPDGQGRRLPRHSWGYARQIDDLARMRKIVERTLPWVRINRKKVYAFGGSMGGQETLLLVARHPRLLAGAAVFDAVTDLAAQYRAFPRLGCNGHCRRVWNGQIGKSLQHLARTEVGDSPGRAPGAYARRSPIAYARKIAVSCVPLQLWWSVKDRVVMNSGRHSGRLFARIRRLNPSAPVYAFIGYWNHTQAMNARSRLPIALAAFELLPPEYGERAFGLHFKAPPPIWCI